MKPLLRTFSNFNQLKLAILTSIENKYAEKLKLRKFPEVLVVSLQVILL
jgi:hypothetical protein